MTTPESLWKFATGKWPLQRNSIEQVRDCKVSESVDRLIGMHTWQKTLFLPHLFSINLCELCQIFGSSLVHDSRSTGSSMGSILEVCQMNFTWLCS